MKKRPFLLLLATFLLSICCLHYSCNPKNCCCELDAPDSLTATGIGPGAFQLDWATVSGASAYQITVKDISSNTTLPLVTTVGTNTLLTGLTTDHEYTAIVQAICDKGKVCSVSPKAAAVCFTVPRGIIIEDHVVMREYHDSLENYCSAYTPELMSIQNNKIPLDFKGNSGVIYQFEVTTSPSPGSPKYYFKLAYESTCVNQIRGFICPQQGVSLTKLTTNSDNVLEFKIVGTNNPLLTLTATSTGINVASSCTNCSIKYREFLGTEPWVGNCPPQ
jgi:hypothetical protein